MCFKKLSSKIVKVGSYNKIKIFFAWIDDVNALSELEELKLYGYLV